MILILFIVGDRNHIKADIYKKLVINRRTTASPYLSINFFIATEQNKIT